MEIMQAMSDQRYRSAAENSAPKGRVHHPFVSFTDLGLGYRSRSGCAIDLGTACLEGGLSLFASGSCHGRGFIEGPPQKRTVLEMMRSPDLEAGIGLRLQTQTSQPGLKSQIENSDVKRGADQPRDAAPSSRCQVPFC